MEYQIGKYYKVKCVEVLSSNGHLIAVLPVIGAVHRDPQFGINLNHYHIDGRFLSKKHYTRHSDGKTNTVILVKDNASNTKQSEFHYAGKEVYRRLKCKRLTTGIVPPEHGKYHDWYRQFVGKSCKGKKCPHLGQEMLEENGRLVCPLHGLQGCAAKEVIVLFSIK